MARTVGALVFPGFELLDLYGPLEMFGLVSDPLDLRIVAERADPVPSAQGPRAAVDDLVADGRSYDILLVPGGRGARTETDNPVLIGWLAEQAARAEIVTTVCTGAALLARTGLLDGMRATSNKAAFAWVQEQGPEVRWVKQARWVEDGKFLTSSGVSAGMDQSLAVIARLYGPEEAAQVATWAEYDWHQDPTWDPFAKIHGLV